MKKEIVFVVSIGLFALAYALDYFAGPVVINLTSPLGLTEATFWSRFPLTGVAMIGRALAMVLLIQVSLSLISYQYFYKAIGVIFVGLLMEFYAIQQLATSGTVTSTQWTLAFAVAPLFLLILIGYYVIKGFLVLVLGTNYRPKDKGPTDQDSKEFDLE